MATSGVKLLGVPPSPFVNRVQISLNLKSVDYEWFPLLKQLQDAEGEEAKAATVGKITEGVVLLEEAFAKCSKGKAFFGGDSIGYVDIALGSCMGWVKAVEKIANFKILDETKTPALCQWAGTFLADKAWSPLLGELRKAEGEEEKAKVMEKIGQGMALLEEAFLKCSKGGAFFGGDSIGYVDIALGGFLGWIKATEILAGRKILDGEKTAGLVGWSERFLLDKAVKDVIMEPEKLAEIYQRFQAAKAN
nr:glutathione S-transferase U17-like [Ipomoea batatas]